MNNSTNEGSVDILLKGLGLPAIRNEYRNVVSQAEREGWDYLTFLHHLALIELDGRRVRHVEMLQKQSGLPKEKTLDRFDMGRMPPKIRHLVPEICKGHFVDRAENILAFGLPGRGKTHLVCGIGHELIRKEIAVYFTTTQKLVSRLLRAKAGDMLDVEIRKLDKFGAVILDDIGYVKQNREEMEVLFTFLAERYERKSVIITSNLVFSQWTEIFKDPMTTAAAIDKLVHHSLILEIPAETVSYRAEAAKHRERKEMP